MIVAVPRESFPGETRVALIPASIPPLAKAGLEVLVEQSAGQAAGYPDEQYVEKGAKIVTDRAQLFAADLIVQVRVAGANPEAGQKDVPLFRQGQTVIGMADPLGSPQSAQAMAGSGATLFALELLPRITRAQAMDVLSSMATVAGYRAVLLGAAALGKMFPMMMTAAGTISPAKVFVMGVGVAGLQAIATARRLGAVVSANDIRPAVKEQVESLGAKFVQLDVDTGAAEDKGGYAKQMSDEFLARQREMIAQVVAESDLVITTAAVPGKRAPILLTGEMVAGMMPGSVVVDLAAERGGNCELTRPGETRMEGGVTILGPANLPAEVPFHASQMYAKNVSNFLQLLLKGTQAKDGAAQNGPLALDREDEIISQTLVTHGGRVVHPRVCELLGIEPPTADATPPVPEKTKTATEEKPQDTAGDEYKISGHSQPGETSRER